jgi:hypothetical protein
MGQVVKLDDIIKARDKMNQDENNKTAIEIMQDTTAKKTGTAGTTTIRITRSVRVKDAATDYEINTTMDAEDMDKFNQYLTVTGFRNEGILQKLKRVVGW